MNGRRFDRAELGEHGDDDVAPVIPLRRPVPVQLEMPEPLAPLTTREQARDHLADLRVVLAEAGGKR